MPALRALHRALPDHDLVLAAPPVLEPLVRLAGVAGRLYPATGLAPLRWAEQAPELAVNLHGRGPQSHRLLSGLRPGRVVGYGCPEAGVPGPSWRAEEHEVHRWCRLVADCFDVPADPGDLTLVVPELPPPVEDAVVIHPGAAYPARRWPPERFAGVARWAAAQGWPVVVTGTADETALADRVRRGAGLPEAALLAGRTDLVQLAALVAHARLVVCGDTGMAHVATALGTPSVVLFGPVSPARWGPATDGPHACVWRGGTGDPWAGRVDPGLLGISAEEVVQCAEATVRRTPGPARGTTPVSV